MLAEYNFEATVKRDLMYGARVLHFARYGKSGLNATAVSS
jgi:hypothetical protein